MKLFHDFVSGDEMFSDTYKMTLQDRYYTVMGTLIKNPATEASEATELVIDVVCNHRLVEADYTKESFTNSWNGLTKKIDARLRAKDPKAADASQKAVQGLTEAILNAFDNYRFYTGESENPEGMVVPMTHVTRDGESRPVFFFLADGLQDENV
jgi:hypothetical protein